MLIRVEGGTQDGHHSNAVADAMYPAYHDDLAIHFRPDGAYLGKLGEFRSSALGFPADMVLQAKLAVEAGFMNTTASQIARYMLGEYPLREIIRRLQVETPEEDPATVESLVRGFVESETRRDRVVFRRAPRRSECTITGSREVYHPTQVAVELTYRCNCRCRHCYVDAEHEARAGDTELDTGSFAEVIRRLIARGVTTFGLTGGEAMLRRDFWEILDACSDAALVGILSNGTLIDEEAVERFNTYRVRTPGLGFGISLDAPNADIHDDLRNLPGTFAKATRAIKLLSEAHHLVRAGMLVWPDNYHLIGETIELARRLGARMFALSPIVHAGRAESAGAALTLTPGEKAVMWAVASRHVDKYGPLFMGSRGKDSFGDTVKEYVGSCGVATNTVAVDPSGRVRPCLMFPSHLTFGNLLTDDYDDIFRRAKGFRDICNTGGDECEKCSALETCKPCVVKGIKAYCRLRGNGFDSCQWGRVHRIEKVFQEAGWNLEAFAGGNECHDALCGGASIPLA